MPQTRWAQRLLERSRKGAARRPERRPRLNGVPLAGTAPPLLSVFQRWIAQRRTERRLLRSNGAFRTTDADIARRSYEAMSAHEFESINATQEWANWRVIPRLFERLPRRPLSIVDLGCGSGGSTAVLARHAPPGSVILGYDAAASLLQRAKQRDYSDAHGAPLDATFVCQSIAETLRVPGGEPLPNASIDFVHASGVVGHHLDVEAADRLAAETARVLAPGGAAVLDAGPRLKQRRLIALARRHGLREAAVLRLFPLNPRASVIFTPK